MGGGTRKLPTSKSFEKRLSFTKHKVHAFISNPTQGSLKDVFIHYRTCCAHEQFLRKLKKKKTKNIKNVVIVSFEKCDCARHIDMKYQEYSSYKICK